MKRFWNSGKKYFKEEFRVNWIFPQKHKNDYLIKSSVCWQRINYFRGRGYENHFLFLFLVSIGQILQVILLSFFQIKKVFLPITNKSLNISLQSMYHFATAILIKFDLFSDSFLFVLHPYLSSLLLFQKYFVNFSICFRHTRMRQEKAIEIRPFKNFIRLITPARNISEILLLLLRNLFCTQY